MTGRVQRQWQAAKPLITTGHAAAGCLCLGPHSWLIQALALPASPSPGRTDWAWGDHPADLPLPSSPAAAWQQHPALWSGLHSSSPAAARQQSPVHLAGLQAQRTYARVPEHRAPPAPLTTPPVLRQRPDRGGGSTPRGILRLQCLNWLRAQQATQPPPKPEAALAGLAEFLGRLPCQGEPLHWRMVKYTLEQLRSLLPTRLPAARHAAAEAWLPLTRLLHTLAGVAFTPLTLWRMAGDVALLQVGGIRGWVGLGRE